jgi:two-component system, chemotaxis family, protein-glutamate methylesterase/glutaminase
MMTRVLVVDDSAVARRFLSDALDAPDLEVVLAVDPYDARDKVLRFAPDVITLDIEMPRMDGLSFLERLMTYHPVPVVVVSAITPEQSEAAVRALYLGAVDVIAKPASPAQLPEVGQQLLHAVRAAAGVDVASVQRSVAAGAASRTAGSSLAGVPEPAPAAGSTAGDGLVVAIGASTGGPAAIERVLTSLPAASPPILIVQHMPRGFTAAFGRRLDGLCAMRVREARDGERLCSGVALVAPGGSHMLLLRGEAGLKVLIRDGPPVHYHKPSVDVLFHSIAQAAGADAIAVLLTGMGSDGASGMRALRDAGAHTIAQDEASSVVFSMPREAIHAGGAADVLPLGRIPTVLAGAFSGRQAGRPRLAGRAP